jgi:hypothetical protein
MTAFTDTAPDLETYWRSIILFGRNVASYKFALAKSLIELGKRKQELILLEDLAEPFARHVCEHLKFRPDRQGGDRPHSQHNHESRLIMTSGHLGNYTTLTDATIIFGAINKHPKILLFRSIGAKEGKRK